MIKEKNAEIDEGDLNSDRIKALFFALHFGSENLIFDVKPAIFARSRDGVKTAEGAVLCFICDKARKNALFRQGESISVM